MRTLRVYLAGKYVTSAFCDEKCDRCRWRFTCFTLDFKEFLEVTPNAEECQYYLITDHVHAEGKRLMRCPYCQTIFTINEQQMAMNTRFKCRICGKFNEGSSTADRYDVLIGEPNSKGRY